ncbi:hypothetical protein M5689_017099 [Euphorbia peplus]|nr:hypothetical protein M5689_017099 [Euphorbia peplus]
MAKALEQKDPGKIPSNHDHPNSMFRLSPQHNGSTLYDSYELRAVTDQLNRAMQNLNSTSPSFMTYLKSPFYGRRLNRIYKENGKTQKLLFKDCSHICDGERTNKIGGLIRRLWKKVKRGLISHKQ